TTRQRFRLVLKCGLVNIVHVINLLDTGLKTYGAMDTLQRELHAQTAGGEHPTSFLIFEAESSYTAARHTQPHDILHETLPNNETDRAGTINAHVPGQLARHSPVRPA